MHQFDTAQICPNGHVANEYYRTYPAYNKTHCDQCGETTITACPNCKEPIKGGNIEWALAYSKPAYCQGCGAEFPWTNRAMQAAIDLASETSLNAEEKQQFKESVSEIARNTPNAQLAGTRIARLLIKMGNATSEAIKDIIVGIASEAVTKIIFRNAKN